MKVYFCGFILLVLVQCIVGPPVDKNPPAASGQPSTNETNADWNLGLEYNKYLQEVVQVLESDPDFRKKLENAKVEEIRDGTIAKELEYVNHNVRTKLDEIKRQELERLRHLAMKQYELSNGVDKKHMKIPQHLEIKHPSFEIQDLHKLIKQTTDDLEEADKNRREDFKKYEMEKKFEKELQLKSINDTQERKVVQEEMEKMTAKHKQHEKLKHPMTKDQLEEVWEEQDHMQPQDWDPKTFFAMHDLDGNGQWDENEVRILFKKELDKAYDPNAPEDDQREREEEMERMREHVFKESDKDKNRMISYDEFLQETKRDEFEKDEGWDTLDEDEDLYTDEEFKQFEHEREEQIQKMVAAGQLPQGYPFGDGAIPGMPPVHPGQYGAPMPVMGPNGVPMVGSVPGQPAYPHPNQIPQHPGQFAGQHPGQFAGQQPPQFAGQHPQFAGQQPPQFAGQQPPQFQQQPPQFAQQPQFGAQQVPGGQPPQFAAQPAPGGQQPPQFAAQPAPGGQQPPAGQPQGGPPQPRNPPQAAPQNP